MVDLVWMVCLDHLGGLGIRFRIVRVRCMGPSIPFPIITIIASRDIHATKIDPFLAPLVFVVLFSVEIAPFQLLARMPALIRPHDQYQPTNAGQR